MTEPVFHQGSWWFQHPNGAWSRWDAASQVWVPYGGPIHFPIPRFSPIRDMARWTVIAIAVDMAASVITIAVNARLLATVPASQHVPIQDFMRVAAGPQVVLQLTGLVSMVAGVLFVVWFYRAYQNLAALKVSGRFSPGWAIGSWLVPILNYFRPKQIANDIWRSSDPSLSSEPGIEWRDGKLDGLLQWWWAMWLITGTVGLVAFPMSFFTELGATESFGTREESFTPFIRSFSIAMTWVSASRLLAGALAIPVVNRMTERQERRAEQLGISVETTKT